MQSATPSLLARLTGKKSHSLRALRLEQEICESDVLSLLNSAPVAPIKRLPGRTGSLLLPVRAGDTGAALREFIDEWIDSGQTKDGGDYPSRRRIAKGGKVATAVFDYSKNKMSLLVDGSGKLVLWLDTPESLRTDHWRLKAALGLAASEHKAVAQCHLVFTLLSPFGAALAKCRSKKCGRYFVLKQPGRPYYGGTLCEEHGRAKHLEASKSATAESRVAAENKLYELTAKRFWRRILADSGWWTNDEMKSEIILHLNKQIHGTELLRKVYQSANRDGVTEKWLARQKNYNRIMTAVEKENHAKS